MHRMGQKLMVFNESLNVLAWYCQHSSGLDQEKQTERQAVTATPMPDTANLSQQFLLPSSDPHQSPSLSLFLYYYRSRIYLLISF